jgi:hypothetical protein
MPERITHIDINGSKMELKAQTSADGSFEALYFHFGAGRENLHKVVTALRDHDRLNQTTCDPVGLWVTCYPNMADVNPSEVKSFLKWLIEDILRTSKRACASPVAASRSSHKQNSGRDSFFRKPKNLMYPSKT